MNERARWKEDKRSSADLKDSSSPAANVAAFDSTNGKVVKYALRSLGLEDRSEGYSTKGDAAETRQSAETTSEDARLKGGFPTD